MARLSQTAWWLITLQGGLYAHTNAVNHSDTNAESNHFVDQNQRVTTKSSRQHIAGATWKKSADNFDISETVHKFLDYFWTITTIHKKAKDYSSLSRETNILLDQDVVEISQ